MKEHEKEGKEEEKAEKKVKGGGDVESEKEE